MKKRRVWIATFNGAAARTWSVNRVDKRLEPAPFPDRRGPHRPDHRDAPPITYQSYSSERGAGDPPVDKERHIEDQFVAELVQDLDAARVSGAFDALIVAATPRALGAFRASAGAELVSIVIAEIPADHVNTPAADVYASLADHF